jgi:hypothetical protein
MQKSRMLRQREVSLPPGLVAFSVSSVGAGSDRSDPDNGLAVAQSARQRWAINDLSQRRKNNNVFARCEARHSPADCGMVYLG